MEDKNCETCGHGKTERILGNGITEPPYLIMVRCPYDPKYYKGLDDYCDQWLGKDIKFFSMDGGQDEV